MINKDSGVVDVRLYKREARGNDASTTRREKLARHRMAIIVAPLSRDLTKFPVGTTGRGLMKPRSVLNDINYR